MAWGFPFVKVYTKKSYKEEEPKMAKVELKQPIVDEIKALLDGAVAVTAVDYLGLTVEQDTALRKELREAGVKYKVFKNTMMNRAFEGTELDELTIVRL